MYKLSKTIVSTAIFTVLGCTSFSPFADEYRDMHKQLSIMNNIITSSTKDVGNNKHFKISRIESTYLKGQGVVFTIKTSGQRNHWRNFNFSMSDFSAVAPIAPAPPIPPTAFDIAPDVELDGETTNRIHEQVEAAIEAAEHSYERTMESMEYFREIREKQRDNDYDLRDVERELKDIEYQLKRADTESKKELKTELTQLAKEKQKYVQIKETLTKQLIKVKEKQKQARAQQEKDRANYFDTLTLSLADSFCLYGNGLKALPKNENVNVIFKASGEKKERRYKDRIFVFSKNDIGKCVSGNISNKELLTKSKQYQF